MRCVRERKKGKKGRRSKRGREKGETMVRCFLVSDVASSRRLVVEGKEKKATREQEGKITP